MGILGGGVAACFLKSSPNFRPKNVIFHTRFQTRPLKSMPVFRPGLLIGTNYVIITWPLERKQKIIQIHFEFACFLFLSYSFGNETLNTFTHSVVPSKTIPAHLPFKTFATNIVSKGAVISKANTFFASIENFFRID